MKILVFGLSDNYGGIESVIMNYYRKIDKTKIQFDFVCYHDKCVCENEIKQLGGKIFKFTGKKIGNKHKKYILNLLKNYDGVWCNRCDLSNISILKFAKNCGLKIRIIHSHNTDIMDKNLFKRAIKKVLHYLNRQVIAKVATNFFACGDLAGKWFYSNKIMTSTNYMVVNNAINIKKYSYSESERISMRKELGIENSFVVGNVGRLQRQKNQTFLIDVFFEILKKNPNSKLLLVGKGEDEIFLRKKVYDLGIEKEVLFLGMRDDINKILHAIDIFIFPSLFEGLPLTLVEAQSSGTHILCSSNITKKVKCGDCLDFVSLSNDAKTWSNIALNCDVRKKKYEEVYHEVKNAGFDIDFEVKKIEGVLLGKKI